ncbi:DUF6319 family protein [Nocardia halotolerans]|uniref:DUF6319 family protein n=1 Tax=Nocardia halotolerans TaxID=1755878 RepID=A0ABV8VGM7_9NOCA
MSSPSTKSASRRSAPPVLSETELARIADELAGGKPPMVWFTAAAVGIAEGKSGKVVALGDPADGDFLQVRPTGSKDVLSFGPSELTLTKPARGATGAPAGSAKTRPAPAPEPGNRKENPVTPQPTTSSSPAPAAPTPASGATAPGAGEATAPKPATTRPAKSAAARKSKVPEVTVTLTGTADGEWTVDVVNGKKRSVKGLAVNSGAVAQAAKILHPEVEEVVAGILEAARDAQQAKVAQLQAELEAAKRLLEELGD